MKNSLCMSVLTSMELGGVQWSMTEKGADRVSTIVGLRPHRTITETPGYWQRDNGTLHTKFMRKRIENSKLYLYRLTYL